MDATGFAFWWNLMQVSDVYSDSEELETLKLSEETSIVISLFINELFWAVALETTVDC
ncbi:hypothetical protein CISIN_1g0354271mg, partial [Citrus sinensis]